MVAFFVPGLEGKDAEERWQSLREASSRAMSRAFTDRRVDSIRFVHDGRGWVAKVGQRQKRFPVRRVPGSPGKPEIDWSAHASEEGPVIVAIFESDDLFSVWQGPGRTVWSNPFMVGTVEVRHLDYFDA